MAMYIKKIRLENIRCFPELTIDFESPGASILISGNNGDGKSTLLRCIAIGLCDETSAAALHRELPGDLVRHGTRDGRAVIDITLVDQSGLHHRITTFIRSENVFEKVYQNVSIDEAPVRSKEAPFPWENIFVSAYGAGMRTGGASDFRDYVAVDAVYPLFKYDATLQNPELAFRRLTTPSRDTDGLTHDRDMNRYADEMGDYLRDILRHVLSLNADDDIVLTSTGLEIKRGDDHFELSSQGDGHQATITWILDLLSWWMIYLKLKQEQTGIQQKQVRGIVLIDEIEQHLHPSWQIKIMELIRDKFPYVQFITSTHSPLVLSSCKDMVIHSLYNGKHEITKAHGWLAEDVYHIVMKMPTSRSGSIQKLSKEYESLHLRSFTGELKATEKERMKSLKQTLETTLPGTDPLGLLTELRILSKDIGRKNK